MTSICSFGRAHPKPQRPAPKNTPSSFEPTLTAITLVVQGGLGIELMMKSWAPLKGGGAQR